MNPFLEAKKNELIEMKKGCNKCDINPRLLKLRPNADLTKYSCNINHLCSSCQSKLSTTIESDLAWAKEWIRFLGKEHEGNLPSCAYGQCMYCDEIKDLQEFIKWVEETKK